MLSALFLLAVLLLVLVNGFFVAAEFALVRARPAKLEEMARARKRGAQRAVDQAADVTNYLSSCQFGITLASLGIGFLGEPAIASLLEPLFGDTISHGLAVAISVGIAYAGHTTVIAASRSSRSTDRPPREGRPAAARCTCSPSSCGLSCTARRRPPALGRWGSRTST